MDLENMLEQERKKGKELKERIDNDLEQERRSRVDYEQKLIRL